MTIKSNKFYRTRAGDFIRTLDSTGHNCMQYAYKCKFLDITKEDVYHRPYFFVFSTGKFLTSEASMYDLVSEVTDPVLEAFYDNG